tara:strand:+ start:164 stop:310 length:147 start_codon:yes stop_codon:yes gene_type:complete
MKKIKLLLKQNKTRVKTKMLRKTTLTLTMKTISSMKTMMSRLKRKKLK